MSILICPYCEQDKVWKVSIDNFNDETFFMCFECDTIWKENEKVEYGTGENFETFITQRGSKPDWSKIKKEKLLEKNHQTDSE
jgi:uncharacterized C2H2 Zn-finger protein